MSENNPFPESDQKAYLRLHHLQYLANHKSRLGRNLVYFGLPSAEMRDIEVWRPVLDKIVAVERDIHLAERMYRTAQTLGVRPKTTILEMDLQAATQLILQSNRDAHSAYQSLSLPVQRRIDEISRTPFDVINLDLCGGFLYPRKDRSSENIEILNNIKQFQARKRHPFVLILTFNLRDNGSEDYESFIIESLDEFQKLSGGNIQEIKDFYLLKGDEGQPANLRKLRFCVPIFLLKQSLQDFQVRSVASWYYKTFYHTVLAFEPRQGHSALGLIWPPVDEFKDLLGTKMYRIEASSKYDGNVILRELIAPIL